MKYQPTQQLEFFEKSFVNSKIPYKRSNSMVKKNRIKHLLNSNYLTRFLNSDKELVSPNSKCR